MTPRSPTNIPTSITARLLNRSRRITEQFELCCEKPHASGHEMTFSCVILHVPFVPFALGHPLSAPARHRGGARRFDPCPLGRRDPAEEDADFEPEFAGARYSGAPSGY